MYPHIYGNTAVCLSVIVSCLSGQKECTNIQGLSESPLEVCILTRRVVTLCPWFHCFRVLVEFELYHQQNWGVMWIPCPRTNTPRENVETPSAFQTSFLEARNSGSYARGTRENVMSGNSPRSLLLHIPPTDPPRRIYRLADSPRRDFGKPGWMVL